MVFSIRTQNPAPLCVTDRKGSLFCLTPLGGLFVLSNWVAGFCVGNPLPTITIEPNSNQTKVTMSRRQYRPSFTKSYTRTVSPARSILQKQHVCVGIGKGGNGRHGCRCAHECVCDVYCCCRLTCQCHKRKRQVSVEKKDEEDDEDEEYEVKDEEDKTTNDEADEDEVQDKPLKEGSQGTVGSLEDDEVEFVSVKKPHIEVIDLTQEEIEIPRVYERHVFADKEELQTAIRSLDYYQEQYGPIGSWDVSNITDKHVSRLLHVLSKFVCMGTMHDVVAIPFSVASIVARPCVEDVYRKLPTTQVGGF